MPDPTAGEVGGILAGIVTVIALFGKGGRWLLGWDERRAQSRSDKLDAWHLQLTAREARIEDRQAEVDRQEAEYRQSIESRLASVVAAQERMQNEQIAAFAVINLLSAAVRAIDPGSQSLTMADDLLRSAFPVEASWPPHMMTMLNRIHAAEVGRSAPQSRNDQ